MNEFPSDSPFQRGDRVQLHGFPGYHLHHAHTLTDHSVIGFRGAVADYLGGTILTVVTDKGRTWVGHWGDLAPEGTPCRGDACGCCPHDGPATRTADGPGRCQPEQASAARARAAGAAMKRAGRSGAQGGAG